MSDQKVKSRFQKIVVPVLIVLAVVVCWKVTASYGESKAEKSAVVLMESSRFEEAAAAMEDLRFRTGSLERKERLRLLLADCYLKLAEKTGIEEDRSLGYYAKLSMLAPEKVPENVRIRLNQKH